MSERKQLKSAQLVGKIYSVYCKDFVSYTEITYYPGEHLNVLVGPNGSGKSTIVAAIMLGLGAGLALLNKDARLCDYIKIGKTEAQLIIKLYGKEEGTKVAFERIICMDCTSKYKYENQSVGLRRFQEIVASYNLHLENLCQFLPQHRVQDFLAMDPHQILLSTLSSVDNDKFINTFNKLKDMRKEQLNAAADFRKNGEALQQRINRLNQLQIAFNKNQEQCDLLKEVHVLKMKRMWNTVENEKLKKVELEKEEMNQKIRCLHLQEKFEKQKEVRDKLMERTAEIQVKEVQKNYLFKKSVECKKKLSAEVDVLCQEMHFLKDDKERKLKQVDQAREEINDLANIINTKKNELQLLEPQQAELDAELKIDKQNLRKLQNSVVQMVQRRYVEHEKLIEKLTAEKETYLNQIQKIKNRRDSKKIEICKNLPHFARAMEWIEENRSKFKGRIYNPMILELVVHKKENAKYIENIVKQRDLFAFVCEEKNDMEQLIDVLMVDKKLSINVIHCPASKACHYKPILDMSKLRPLGFHSYLIDLLSGPPTMINKLCLAYSIHNIPIGKMEIMDMDSEVPLEIHTYFAGNRRLTRIKSRYSDAMSSMEVKIEDKNLLIVTDPNELASLEKKLAKTQANYEKAVSAHNSINEEVERDRANLDALKIKCNSIELKKDYYNNLKAEIEKHERQLNTLNESLNISERTKKEFQNILKVCVEKIHTVESKLIDEFQNCQSLLLEMHYLNALVYVLNREMAPEHSSYNEIQEEHRSAINEKNRISDAIAQMVQKIYKLHTEARNLCKGRTPIEPQFPYKEDFEKMSTLTEDELIEAIHKREARLECLGKKIEKSTIDEFYKCQEEINNLKTLVQNGGEEEKNQEIRMKRLFNKWEKDLNELIDKISRKFGQFMASMSYLGEVVICRKDKFDLNSYGIQIWVQYRQNAKLQILDKHTQSGGERAVAIAVYSLSLQHITQVPFRCVDEINQGMDAINERNIFHLLLEEAAKPDAAQYLFVTPKLQRNLNYNEYLFVSVVHNSQSLEPGLTFPTCTSPKSGELEHKKKKE